MILKDIFTKGTNIILEWQNILANPAGKSSKELATMKALNAPK
jgi:hypothetical protein